MKKIKAISVKFYKQHTHKIVVVQLCLIAALFSILFETAGDLEIAMKLGGVTSAQIFYSKLPNPN